MNYIGLTQNFNLIYDKLYANKKNLRLQLDIIQEYSKLLNDFSGKLQKAQTLYTKPEYQNSIESMILPLSGYFTQLQHNLQATATAFNELETRTESERRKLSDTIREKQKVFQAVFQPVSVLRQQLQKHEQKLRDTYKKLEQETDKGKILQMQRAAADMEKQQQKMVNRIRQLEEKVDPVIPLQAQPIQQLDQQMSILIQNTNTEISTILQQFVVQQNNYIQQNFVYQSADSNIQNFFNMYCNNFSKTFVQTKYNDVKLEEDCKQGARIAEMVTKQNLRKVQSTAPTPAPGALDKAVKDAAKTGPTMPKNIRAGDDIQLEDIFGGMTQPAQVNTAAPAAQGSVGPSGIADNWGQTNSGTSWNTWDNAGGAGAGNDWGFGAQQPLAEPNIAAHTTTAPGNQDNTWDNTYNYQQQNNNNYDQQNNNTYDQQNNNVYGGAAWDDWSANAGTGNYENNQNQQLNNDPWAAQGAGQNTAQNYDQNYQQSQYQNNQNNAGFMDW